MDWTRNDAEIDGCIARLRDDQRAWVQMSEDAANVIALCHLRMQEDADEIERLMQEQH